MTKEEFQNLTDIHDMSDENFEKVNRAHIELDALDKKEFCRLYTEDLPTLIGLLVDTIRRHQRKCQGYLKCIETVTPRLLKCYHEDAREPLADALDVIEESIGTRRFILSKVMYSSLFTAEELDYLLENLP